MSNLRVLLFVLLVACAACLERAQSGDEVPGEVRRRLAQAIWPENLFDAAGNPEPGFVRRPFRPDFADLQVRRGLGVPELPGVAFYVAEAYPSGCSHCRTWRAAVAERGEQRITLLAPEDLQHLASWVGRPVLEDSSRLRAFILGALQSTCLVGCDPIQVRNPSDIPDAASPFLRAVNGEGGEWSMPRTYSWQSDGATVVEFPLFVRGTGVFITRAQWSGRELLHVAVEPVARYMWN